MIPVELGGFNTLAAVDVAARHGIPVVDADGAGRSVPEVHLKVYTIDDIRLAPMTIADVDAQNIVVVKQTRGSTCRKNCTLTRHGVGSDRLYGTQSLNWRPSENIACFEYTFYGYENWNAAEKGC